MEHFSDDECDTCKVDLNTNNLNDQLIKNIHNKKKQQIKLFFGLAKIIIEHNEKRKRINLTSK